MGSKHDNLPILVGAGQHTVRTEDVERLVHPMEMMKTAVERAADDAACPALIDQADALHVVNVFSWSFRDAPSTLAAALGARPALREYTAIGGNTPQWLVNRAADNLAAGRSEIAILAGCEVMRSVTLAAKAGKDIGSQAEVVAIEVVGDSRSGSHDVEVDHFADLPIRVYPMIENALRAKEGVSLEQQRAALGKFGETYSAVAAKNPYAWFPVARSAEEVVTPSATNRMIAYPYTKFLNSVLQVDQAAAVIMTTTGAARRLGVPEDRWVYPHGGQDGCDHWYLSEREDVADSPAVKAIVQDALDQAGVTLDEIAFFDFYSCFPCMPRLTRHVLGISHDDPRPMTLTGGLPYFGGPGSNYVMHSIAEAMRRCRASDGAFGMVTSNGWYCTKHGVGIYSAAPPKRRWSRPSPAAFGAELALGPAVEIEPEPTGAFDVEAYTVWHDRAGAPEIGILCGRTESGRRAWAHTPKGDRDVLRAMMNAEWVGRRGRVTRREGGVNVVAF